VKFGRPEVGEIARYLMDKKNKISARDPAAATERIAPKICARYSSKQYTRSLPNSTQIRSLPAEL